MLRKFYKMHGIGNDYIYFDCLDTPLENPEAAALKLSDRHFGIGGDGIVLICPSALADAKMRMFNADGSEGKMCGNAIRCLGKYLYDFQKTNKTTLKIETLSGVKTLFLNVENGKTQSVKVDMGAPSLSPEQIPVRLGGKAVVGRETEIAGGRYAITCVSMGNPHCGETWACGTGACSAAVAAVLNGYAARDEDIVVHLRGGDLIVRWTKDTVYMTGTATLVFTGEVDL